MGDAVGEGGCGARWSALGETGVDGGFSAGVGEEQVLDDLLDAPLAGACGWAELRLCGVEAVEGVCDLALELVEGGVHRDGVDRSGVDLGRITLHGLGKCRLVPLGAFLFC